MLARFVSTLVVASVGLLGPAHAADLLVPSQYATIQAAIDAAVTGDRVLIAAGTYPEAIDFLGKDIEVLGAGMDDTVIDATGLDTSVVKIMSGEGPAAVLEGVTLTGGVGSFVPGNTINRFGGGLNVWASNPTIRWVRFQGNHVSSPSVTEFGGGASFQVDLTTLAGMGLSELPFTPLEDCEFIGNSTARSGGGLYLAWVSDAFVRRCRFAGNTVPNGASASTNDSERGGGVYCAGFTLGTQAVFEDCIFVSNRASRGGGAAVSNSTAARFQRCAFYANSGTGWFGGGGAAYIFGAGAFDHCVLLSNAASHYGGGIRMDSAEVDISNTVCWNQSAGLDGPDVLVFGALTTGHSYIFGSFTDSPESLAEPGFVDPTADWRLRPWSKLVDAGDPSGDLDADGSPPDIGIGGVLLPASPFPIVGDRYTYLTPQLSNFGQALDFADAVGGRLLELRTPAEEAQLASFPTYSGWIGLRRIGGVWQWGDGTPAAWTNWAVGQPNNSGPQVVRSHLDGTWNDLPSSYDYPAIIERDEPFTLLPNTPRLSVSAEDELALTLNVGAEHAGESFLVLGSVSGTEPGLPLGPFHLPLNFDAFTNWTLNKPNNPFLANSLGVIDGKGWAVCRFRLVSGIPSGFPVSFAAVTFLPGAQKTSVTNAVSVQLDP